MAGYQSFWYCCGWPAEMSPQDKVLVEVHGISILLSPVGTYFQALILVHVTELFSFFLRWFTAFPWATVNLHFWLFGQGTIKRSHLPSHSIAGSWMSEPLVVDDKVSLWGRTSVGIETFFIWLDAQRPGSENGLEVLPVEMTLWVSSSVWIELFCPLLPIKVSSFGGYGRIRMLIVGVLVLRGPGTVGVVSTPGLGGQHPRTGCSWRDRLQGVRCQ